MSDVRKVAEDLRAYAAHFSPRDWNYTRDIPAHLRDALAGNLPDGVLDGGSIITYWEETGEYLQFMQPSVGAMIADWLEDQPDNPHAQRVAAEMWRIQDAYVARLRSPSDAGSGG